MTRNNEFLKTMISKEILIFLKINSKKYMKWIVLIK